MRTLYRFVTPHRAGKWYADLAIAQAQACTIGAGYFDRRSGQFYQYPGVTLEQRDAMAEIADPVPAG